jgi:hypothetical protein
MKKLRMTVPSRRSPFFTVDGGGPFLDVHWNWGEQLAVVTSLTSRGW